MKALHRITYLAVIYGLLLSALHAEGDSPSSPYFQIIGKHDDSSNEQLPLKSSAAKVTIDGTIARVHLTQRYANSGSIPIEAIYVFPASTRAAVHGMTLTTGGRVIAARIQESVKAKAEYETAKAEKKTAALLEEHRPNVFQMSVANLLPGDDIDVEIDWTETIPAVDSTYEFVFPTVVGPRYTGGSAAGNGETWTANPHLQHGAPSPATFTLEASLTTTLPLAEVTCPSHPLAVDFKAKDRALVKIDSKSGAENANRDFILRWKLGNDQVDAGLLLNHGLTKNHFLLQIAPPPRVALEQIPPRDYVMVIDVSGSMEGFPLNTAKDLLRNLVKGLRPEDTFNVVSFASGSGVLSETALPANDENVSLAVQFIGSRQSGGGTELEAALKRALALPGGEDRSRSILLITDGYVNVEAETAELIRTNIGRANLFTFGIGSAVNRELLESVARAGGGEPVIVTTGKEAGPAAAKFREWVSNPVLAKVQITADGVALGGIEPDPYPDVFASRPLIVTGTWTGEPKGKIIVRGIGGNGTRFEKSIDLAEAAAATGLGHPAVPVLWARERVRHLTEGAKRDQATIGEITSLGLNYSLLTPYTSFLAVDETPRAMEGLAQTVKQPLPMPQGVSKSAVGGSSPAMVQNGSVPEPGSIGLIAFLVVLLALQRQRDLQS
ncbi:MAG: VIT domain-containing protein [Luteolibacter sp.]|uniref:VIT and vWA domain-containing protein n=1 Tax=Luteolibacter sp. TaxID=1962973 RepID=UPI003265FB1D